MSKFLWNAYRARVCGHPGCTKPHSKIQGKIIQSDSPQTNVKRKQDKPCNTGKG
ncbi:hypothetical protein F442_05948 [Phytophthora nicotianae P10297]|uniref:Uncharacterized protein n=2 Tax=Phytophthora nicotianae TaxID=4792 RepID=W2ZLX9_PHYNI|nr:hypothetical protein F442_05948 [Phytophthora nicotianae P10297]